jgi:2-polyprenyl-3-methyl-5-hydroxy-6-metoxy-1,4-benzoquinol methylase
MWDEKFDRPDHLYGVEPNDFLRACADQFPAKGRVISLGEGEGRNAVFLAKQGYAVTALDSSSVGLEKTKRLAKANGVDVETKLSDLSVCEVGNSEWDGVVVVFCHLPSALRSQVWQKIAKSLKPGGVLVMELYTPKQLEATKAGRSIGGPKDLDLLVTVDELRNAFPSLEFRVLREVEREIQEGEGHRGPSHTVQVLGKSRLV